MSEGELREVNKIPASMLVKGGSTLLVPRASSTVRDVSPELADNAVMSLTPDVPPLRRMTLRAGKHETVAGVAKRYRVPAAQVAQWNHTTAHAKFKPGESIIVYVPQKAARSAKASAGSTKSSKSAATKKGAASKKATPAKKSAPAKKTVKKNH